MARRELPLALELGALTSFAFARPTLATFGRSPETFIARGSDGLDVVLFGVVVLLLPLAGVVAIGVSSRLAGGSVRRWVHLGLVGGLSSTAALLQLRMDTGLSLPMAILAATAIGGAVALLRWRVNTVEAFLRYAGIASVLYLVQFLALSPAGSLVWGGRSAGVDPEATAALREAVGDDAPPVVMVVLDALPTAVLLDGEGRIDAELYPNLAELAGQATWYRNHTTVAPVTLKAVPAILSGTLSLDEDQPPVASAYPRNLFTLLGGTHDLQVKEQVTALCPDSLCPTPGGSAVRPLLNDARGVWSQMVKGGGDPELIPGVFSNRYERFDAWIDGLDFEADRPGLYFFHHLLPHPKWQHLPDGSEYAGTREPFGSFAGAWGDLGYEVGAQRQALQTQAVDRQLGRLFDRMRHAGAYDDAVVVVTADHGIAFEPNARLRGVGETQFEQVMWTPLLIKAPGQERGHADDTNAQTIDILPTVADILGVDLEGDLGWELDGQVLGKDPARPLSDKAILDWKYSELRSEDGDLMVRVDGREGFERVLDADLVEGSGSDAVWRRTRYGALLGREVDELEQNDPFAESMSVHGMDALGDVDLDEPPLELQAFGWVEVDQVVAVAINGRIAATVPTRPTEYGVSIAHALVHPDTLVEGRNRLELFLVDGPIDDPVLQPLPVTPAED